MGTATPCPAGGKSWSCTGLSPPCPVHPSVQGAWAETHNMATLLGQGDGWEQGKQWPQAPPVGPWQA